MLNDVMRAGQQLLDALELQRLASRRATNEDATLSLADAREFVDSAAIGYAAAMKRLRGTELSVKFISNRQLTADRVGNSLVS